MDPLENTSQPSVNPSQYSSEEPAVNNSVNQAKPLIYEETPVIQPIESNDQSAQPMGSTGQPESPIPTPVSIKQPDDGLPVAPPARKGNSIIGWVKNLIIVFVLFGIGIGLSLFLKQYFPSVISAIPSLSIKNPIPSTPQVSITPTAGVNPYANWKSYPVTSGIGNQKVNGITYMLPNDVLAPICDGGNCSSSGTYLPGGTRFTVDARGIGQLLPDFRGKILTDQGGREFSMKDTVVAGRAAKEFSGIFTGTTSGGYAFSRMRGVMVEVSDTLSVEFNHFTPTLVNADFTSDDVLFDKVVQSIQITVPTTVPVVTQSAIQPSATPSSVPTVTPTSVPLVTPRPSASSTP